MNKTHKFKQLGDVAAVMRAAASIADAARTLGVERSTLHRWIKAGKVPHPARMPRTLPTVEVPVGQSPDEWAAAVRSERELSPTDDRLVGLAAEALRLTLEGHPSIRLQAMGRFQMLVRQLRLEAGPVADQVPTPTRAPAPRRTGTDPRALLMAVK